MSESGQTVSTKSQNVRTLVRRLRPEARPLAWASLDAAQQNAFEEIASWLSSAASAVGQQSKDRGDYGGWLDRDRASRIATLAGGRGTGKTTALLSLIDACRFFKEGQGQKESDFPDELHRTLHELGPKLVWLEPLDLEPLPKSSNLLAAILARIDAEVRRPRGPVQVSGWIGKSFQSSESKNPLLDLMQLQTDVALAWDGNLSARSGQLDPDVYATEVMRAENARLMLNRRLANLLDDLATLILGNRDLLFVLPIDDCDLNPALAVPLLRLLRMTSVPRLFTIVLADEGMGRTVFKLKYQGELVEAAAPTGVLDNNTKSLESIADQVGFNALRKLLPPGQRVYLTPMRARTVLALNNGLDTPTIRDLLRSFRLQSLWDESENTHHKMAPVPTLDGFINNLPSGSKYTRIETILDIIDAERLVFLSAKGASESERVGKRRSAYSGRAFFREPARRAIDLWARLYGICHSQLSMDERLEVERAAQGRSTEELDRQLATSLEWKKIRLLLNYLAERVEQAMEEEPVFTAWVGAIIAPNWERDYELDAHYLKLVPPPRDVAPTRVRINYSKSQREMKSSSTDEDVLQNSREADSKIHGFLDFQEVNDWYLEIKVSNPQDLEDDEREIQASRDLRAGLTLFSDYVAMYDRERLARGSIRPDPIKLRCAVAHWRSSDGVLDHEVHWPAPDWESLWPYDLLTTAWSEAVRWLNPRIERPELDKSEFFAFIWILNATCLVTRVIPQQVSGQIPPSHNDWRNLVAATADLIPLADLSRRHRHIKTWLLYLPCLLAPEAGLPPTIADYFTGLQSADDSAPQKALVSYWRNNAEEIRFNRASVMDLGKLEKEQIGRNLAVSFGALEIDSERRQGDHPINQIDEGILRPRLYRASADISKPRTSRTR